MTIVGGFAEWIQQRATVPAFWVLRSIVQPDFHFQGRIEGGGDLWLAHEAAVEAAQRAVEDAGTAVLPLDAELEVRKFNPPDSWRQPETDTEVLALVVPVLGGV